MVAILAKGLIALFIAFSALIGAVHAGRSAPATLNEVFADACDSNEFGMCFLGIELGETSLDTARDLLEHHAWVASVNPYLRYDPYDVAYLNFLWRDPELPERTLWEGELITPVDTVEGVRLKSELTLGDLWVTLGRPTIVVHNRQQGNRDTAILVYYLFYSDNAVAVANMPACPITFRNFLMGRVYTLEFRGTAFASAQDQRNIVENIAELLRELRANSVGCE